MSGSSLGDKLAMAKAIRETWLIRDRDEENFEDNYSCMYCESTTVSFYAKKDVSAETITEAIKHEPQCPVLISDRILNAWGE